MGQITYVLKPFYKIRRRWHFVCWFIHLFVYFEAIRERNLKATWSYWISKCSLDLYQIQSLWHTWVFAKTQNLQYQQEYFYYILLLKTDQVEHHLSTARNIYICGSCWQQGRSHSGLLREGERDPLGTSVIYCFKFECNFYCPSFFSPQLPKDISIFHTLDIIREQAVENLKPAVVAVYDYYQPRKSEPHPPPPKNISQNPSLLSAFNLIFSSLQRNGQRLNTPWIVM